MLPMSREAHITSLAVQVRPARLAAVAAAIAALPEAEVFAQAPEGKLVVVLETSTDGDVMDRLGVIRDLDGVLAAHLVFHRILDDTALEATP
jgi:nitrate reductase NapD